jgi:hypothetical protein
MKLFIWKIGNLEHQIYPSATVVDKLRETVSNVVDDLDNKKHAHLIWGPDLDIEVLDIDDNAQHVVLDVQKVGNGQKIDINIVNSELEDQEAELLSVTNTYIK